MITRGALVDYLATYLSCHEYQDYAPNGLQIEGREPIVRLCTAVSASASVIQHAVACGADALLVHHGFFWKGEALPITGIKRQRIASFLRYDLNLLAYHLPLDGHPVLGNNACLAQMLGIGAPRMHTVNQIPRILWSGDLPQGLSLEALSQHMAQELAREPLVIRGHERPNVHVAWCSGAGQDLIEDAARLGADAFISGEVSERTYYLAQELGINYLSCGHHATERAGIFRLGQHLALEFNLENVYIETDNPI